jgi:hypothetical protein
MAAQDLFARFDPAWGVARRQQFDITPSDADELEFVTSAVWVESADAADLVTVAFVDAEGNDAVVIVPAFTLIYWIRMKKIKATDTTPTATFRGYP